MLLKRTWLSRKGEWESKSTNNLEADAGLKEKLIFVLFCFTKTKMWAHICFDGNKPWGREYLEEQWESML